MKLTRFFLGVCLCWMALCKAQVVLGQQHLAASDKIAPRWLHKPPKASSSHVTFIHVTTHNSSIEAATEASLDELTKHLPRDWSVKRNGLTKIDNTTERDQDKIVNAYQQQTYRLEIETEGSPVSIRCQQVDSYWKQVYLRGNLNYENTILYQVAKPGYDDSFEETYTTSSYGAHGLWRSAIVPGWGQFHKGSALKGGLFLGGTVVLAGGLIYAENQRASYESKVNTHGITTQQLKTYKNKMDNFETARNVCIGAAAALYIYNLIDAVVAPGARRVVVKPRRYALAPYVSGEGSGVSMAYTFK